MVKRGGNLFSLSGSWRIVIFCHGEEQSIKKEKECNTTANKIEDFFCF
jgi:hypothetical protein